MKFFFPSCSFLNTNDQFATSLFVYLSVFCCCILELGNKATPSLQHFSSVLQRLGGDGSNHERTGERFAVVAEHNRAPSWLSRGAAGQGIRSTRPLASVGFSVNKTHFSCFFAPFQAPGADRGWTASIWFSCWTASHSDHESWHQFLLNCRFRRLAGRSRALGLPRAEPAPGQLAAMLHGPSPAGPSPFFTSKHRGLFCSLCLKGFGFSVAAPRGEAGPSLGRGTLLPRSLLAKAPSVTPGSS